MPRLTTWHFYFKQGCKPKFFAILPVLIQSFLVDICMPYRCSAQADSEKIQDYSITVSDTIGQVGAMQWDKHIPAANVLMQYENLQLTEAVHGSKMGFRYVFVKKDDVTVGVLYFQVVMFHANQLINYYPAFKEGNVLMATGKKITEKLLNAINLKLLVSGNVFMTGENGFYFNNEVEPATRARIVRAAIRQMVKSDSSIKAALISDSYEPKTTFDTEFEQCGYHEITVESDMSIQLKTEWKTFDDYLNALSSKYRVRAKKVFTLCNEAGVELKDLTADEIALHEKDIYRLYNKVMENADFKLAELSIDFFRKQKQQLPDNYKLYGYFKDGVLIGFISAFCFGKRMEVHYTGMDHEVCKPIHLYQRMMYDMVKLGIESHAAQLHFGRTAPEIKSTIGAVPSAMYGYVKYFNPVFNFLFVRPYTANLKPKEYTFRNPFK